MGNVSRRSFITGSAAAGLGGAATLAAASAVLGTPAAMAIAPGIAGGEMVRTSATAPGFGGDVTVELLVDTVNDIVVECTITGEAETPDKGGRAIAKLADQINSIAGIEVDIVNGATVTSTAVQDAAAAAFAEAKGSNGPIYVNMKPGRYTGYAKGYWQIWDLPVTITVNESSILAIDVPTDRFAHGETEVILRSVKDLMFPRIIRTQSIGVDCITGATSTSNAVKQAIRQALREALEAGDSSPSAVAKFQVKPVWECEPEPIVKDVDVLVVGMSTGGIFAMKSAMETIKAANGGNLVSVLGIDRAGKYGGRSALTHEGCAINPPRFQQDKNGGEDFADAEGFKAIWKNFTTTDGVQYAKEDIIDLFFEESGATIDWMYADGWIFGSMGEYNPTTDGRTSYNVALTSNVDTGTYEDRRKILDQYYKQILADVVAQGGDYMLETEGYAFIMDGGRVAGVKARNLANGQEYVINAKAVVMGCGGFSDNPRMIDGLLPEQWRGERKAIGVGQATGAMFQAALEIGAATYNMDASPNVMHVQTDHWLTRYPINFYDDKLDGRTGRYKAWTLNNIPLACGISGNTLAVKRDGTRFMNEARYESFARTPEEESWPCYLAGSYYYTILSDDVLAQVASEGFNKIFKWEGYMAQGDIPKDMPVPEVYEGLGYSIEEGMAWKGETLAELAVQIDIDPDVLQGEVDAYNALVDAGEDTRFGKDPEYLTRLETGPWYAVRIYPAHFCGVGGLDVDTRIRVLDTAGEPIPGLYAIGTDSMGVILSPKHNYVGFGGVAQGWLWTSGRLAGINAAEYVAEAFGGYTYVSPALVDVAATSSAR